MIKPYMTGLLKDKIEDAVNDAIEKDLTTGFLICEGLLRRMQSWTITWARDETTKGELDLHTKCPPDTEPLASIIVKKIISRDS